MVGPAIWGPPLWDAIHFVAAGYPVQPTDADVRAYGDFFRGLADVLPCAPCRHHFAAHIREIPPEGPLAAGRAELFAWTVAFHNAVNASLDKPPMTLEYAYERYFEEASHRNRERGGHGGGLGLGLGIMAVVALMLIIATCLSLRKYR